MDSVSPVSGRASERATLIGAGFAANASVDVGGVAATVVSATGTQLVFEVPSAAAAGSTTVGVSSGGQSIGSVAFTVLEGKLLAGDDQALAVSAIFSLPPVPVDEAQIEDGLIATRVDLHLTADATVGDVNAALRRVDGGIVSMTAQLPALTIAIPRPADQQALANVLATLSASKGIAFADAGRVASVDGLPPSPHNETLLAHLIAERFPAAWNLSALATQSCESHKVTVLVADHFGALLVGDQTRFVDELPTFVDIGPGGHVAAALHGYEVATT
ncbi:MAG TPA: IPT/TIG domain-containing protein, partial [Gammaproteobacteria bacterium]|nr:IPT/TIG domain-containing protein [Gammaproteobacteria bacterium]